MRREKKEKKILCIYVCLNVIIISMQFIQTIYAIIFIKLLLLLFYQPTVHCILRLSAFQYLYLHLHLIVRYNIYQYICERQGGSNWTMFMVWPCMARTYTLFWWEKRSRRGLNCVWVTRLGSENLRWEM